jgi:hypothetical protein
LIERNAFICQVLEEALFTGLERPASAMFCVLFDEDPQNPVFTATQVLDIHYFQAMGCSDPIRRMTDLLNAQCHNCRRRCFAAKEKWAFAHSFLRVAPLNC